MSSEHTIRPASEMNEADDLPAFEGVIFSDDLCRSCGRHLAVKDAGLCTLCIAEIDSLHREALEFDAELSDAMNGMGNAWSW